MPILGRPAGRLLPAADRRLFSRTAVYAPRGRTSDIGSIDTGKAALPFGSGLRSAFYQHVRHHVGDVGSREAEDIGAALAG